MFGITLGMPRHASPHPVKTTSKFVTFMNFQVHTKTQLHTSTSFWDIVGYRILQSDWSWSFWTKTQKSDFSQICGFWWKLEVQALQSTFQVRSFESYELCLFFKNYINPQHSIKYWVSSREECDSNSPEKKAELIKSFKPLKDLRQRCAVMQKTWQ